MHPLVFLHIYYIIILIKIEKLARWFSFILFVGPIQFPNQMRSKVLLQSKFAYVSFWS
jgi:hypothetical protein